jgi:hypothetical protein
MQLHDAVSPGLSVDGSADIFHADTIIVIIITFLFFVLPFLFCGAFRQRCAVLDMAAPNVPKFGDLSKKFKDLSSDDFGSWLCAQHHSLTLDRFWSREGDV